MPELKYRSKKGRILKYNEYLWDAEPGDKMVTRDGEMFLLTESTGKDKRAAGVLTPRRIYPPNVLAKAVIRDNEAWWVW